jgi:heme exporter protein D
VSPGAATPLPVAHAGHYFWTIYVVPLAVVLWSIIRSVREQRRERRRDNE